MKFYLQNTINERYLSACTFTLTDGALIATVTALHFAHAFSSMDAARQILDSNIFASALHDFAIVQK